MPTLPGGKIIGGTGGRIWTSQIPFTPPTAPSYSTFQGLNGLTPKSNIVGGGTLGAESSLPFLDISQWSITRIWIYAEVPHSGCVGGVTRRLIGRTWRFSASLQLDQSNFPESLLIDDRFAIAFYLGDVTTNPEAIYMGMYQAFYFSPRACISHISPVLNATGDVIRVNIAGEESCRLFYISGDPSVPDDSDLCTQYMTYLNLHKGWL